MTLCCKFCGSDVESLGEDVKGGLAVHCSFCDEYYSLPKQFVSAIKDADDAARDADDEMNALQWLKSTA